MKNLLVELFVEELPPKSLRKLGESFLQSIFEQLKLLGLTNDRSQTKGFATPRRLAVHITDVKVKAEDKHVSQKLMPVSFAIDAQGKATPAFIKKLGSLGLDESVIPQLKKLPDGKGEAFFYDSTVSGIDLSKGLQTAFDVAIEKLPIAKVMSYQLANGWDTVHFVRPAHALIALHDDVIVPIEKFGLKSDRITYGHRFESKKNIISINCADSYQQQLREEGAVIASFHDRKQDIVQQLTQASSVLGLQAIEDDALLDEVTSLVEQPNILTGTFEKEFLQVPQECLILTMKANQKYFPLLDQSGKLTNKFLIVSNITPVDASLVVQGNERVVRPRLADAKFFFDQDRKKTLSDRVAGLDKVVYHNKLGTQGQRSQRVQLLAYKIAMLLEGELLAQQAQLAAKLAKTDLLTEMVGEFPELQGIMGRYYAQHDGLGDNIAFAIEDHYRPRFAGDALPRSLTGICVALADKMETLVGMFGIGQLPTGDKDPFALRRHALGIIRMLTEQKLNVRELIDVAFGVFPNGMLKEAKNEVYTFMLERLTGTLKEQGFTANEVDAIVSLQPIYFDRIQKQLKAVQSFTKLDAAAALTAANKRVGNILKKHTNQISDVNIKLLHEPVEIQLFEALQTNQAKVQAAFQNGEFELSLKLLAELRQPIDAFFEGVMVNVEDLSIRDNRIALLSSLQAVMNLFADISKL